MKAIKVKTPEQYQQEWERGQRKLAQAMDRKSKRVCIAALLPGSPSVGGGPGASVSFTTLTSMGKTKVTMTIHSGRDIHRTVSGEQALRWLGFDWRKLGM